MRERVALGIMVLIMILLFTIVFAILGKGAYEPSGSIPPPYEFADLA